MAAPTKVFESRWDVKFTTEQVEAIKAKAALSGRTPSQVVRDLVDQHLLERPSYLATPAKKAS